MRSEFSKLLKILKKNFPESDLEIVRKTYRLAASAHQGQERLSGEPYIIHSLAVAQNLAGLGLDPITCAAGLLHDVLEDTDIAYNELKKAFNEEIATLVEGVTKISNLTVTKEEKAAEQDGLTHAPNLRREIKQAQNLRKMLVATAKDVRVIMIKLADRLHNIRTLDYLPKEKRERIARKTLEIYAPLAHRLGISNWKWELEDHAFRVLMPEEYKEIAAQVAMKRKERESDLHDMIHFLETRLHEAEVPARVIGRPKHLYSIYQKMVRQGKDFNEVLDIQAIRIITHTESGCYNALGVVHSIWTPIPGRLKDYIAMPKLNMYQAIHTTVMRVNGRPMEIQIRSEEMDKTAREGIAAHWIYKEGKYGKDRRLDNQLAWLRQMYEWIKDAHVPEDLMDNMRQDFKATNIYVFTPKGEVKELPQGATPLDFAYLIHSDIGHHCMGARVNNRMVPLRYHLQTGDVVEILTSKNQTPHLDWVDIVVTGRARTSIRQRLRELGLLEPLPQQQDSAKSRESAQPPQARPIPAPTPVRKVRQVDDATRHKLIRIEGWKGMGVQFAKCCDPMPGHAIIGYVTKSQSISVHRADCRGFAKSPRDPNRIVEASWEGEGAIETGIRVQLGMRPNAIADITNALRPMNLEIQRARYGPDENGKAEFVFVFMASDRSTIDRVMRTLRTVTGVTMVNQLDIKQQSLAAVG